MYLAVWILDGEEHDENPSLPCSAHSLLHKLSTFAEHSPAVRHDQQQLRQVALRVALSAGCSQHGGDEVHHFADSSLSLVEVQLLQQSRHAKKFLVQ